MGDGERREAGLWLSAITLGGTLDFETRGGDHSVLLAGDVLLAEDTTGAGHSWKLVDDQPWRRLDVVLAPDAPVPFEAAR